MKFCEVPTLVCGLGGVTVIPVRTALHVSELLLLIAPTVAEMDVEPPLIQVAFSVAVKLVSGATDGSLLAHAAVAVTS
jgi:hypothetical protein